MDDPRFAAMELIFGRWRSQILHAGVRLGILDAVKGGAQTADEVASQQQLDPERTYRMMRALGSLQLLSEGQGRAFAVTPAGEFLCADHPQTLRGMTLLEEGPQHYAVWTHLCDIVRDGGQDGFRREYGHPLFEHVTADPDYGAVFDDAMSSYSAGESAMVLDALAGCDFSKISHLCDVAGGLGHLLCSLLVQYPALRGTILDLPGTVERTDMHWAGKMNVADRLEYVAGDMFRAIPEADAYLLKHILHDWNDDECVQILSNMRDAGSATARTFVAEFIVPGPETPHFAKLFDIHMMCGVTGRERTEEEYGALFDRSGWRYVKTWYTTTGPMGVVEAVSV